MPAIRFYGLSFITVTGIAGLICDAWPRGVPWASGYMHAAFGASLLSMVVVSCGQGIAGEVFIDATAHKLCRRLSRDVYLLLYLVFGANLIIRAAAGAVDSTAPVNLRDYFAYGLAALVTIRALTVFNVRQPPTPRMNQRLAPAEDAAAPQ